MYLKNVRELLHKMLYILQVCAYVIFTFPWEWDYCCRCFVCPWIIAYQIEIKGQLIRCECTTCVLEIMTFLLWFVRNWSECSYVFLDGIQVSTCCVCWKAIKINVFSLFEPENSLWIFLFIVIIFVQHAVMLTWLKMILEVVKIQLQQSMV